MSETNPPPIPPAPPEPPYQYVPPPPSPRSGCATAFMVLFGLVLLLPGLCALLFGFGVLSEFENRSLHSLPDPARARGLLRRRDADPRRD
ncbi:hypothetical protein [Bradyrhizobium sp. BR 1433]|uniref:hypothetical protein n=1 Tax=Bradyrhizobium sp. BR 1433 TaxID=3447967 RepID=UPI003EE4CC00